MTPSEAELVLAVETARAGVVGWTLRIRDSQAVNAAAIAWRREIVVTRGALALDHAMVRALIAHEVGHTRQRARWMFVIAPALALGLAWVFGASWAVAPIGAAIGTAYMGYEAGADAWASASVGAAPVEALLRLTGERWRAALVVRRARRQAQASTAARSAVEGPANADAPL